MKKSPTTYTHETFFTRDPTDYTTVEGVREKKRRKKSHTDTPSEEDLFSLNRSPIVDWIGDEIKKNLKILSTH